MLTPSENNSDQSFSRWICEKSDLKPQRSSCPARLLFKYFYRNTWDVTVKTDFQNTVVSLASSLGPTGSKLKKKKEKKNEPKTQNTTHPELKQTSDSHPGHINVRTSSWENKASVCTWKVFNVFSRPAHF